MKPAARSRAAGLLAGTLADALLGDPQRGHPVALFGRAAEAMERRVYARSRLRGAGFAGACLALAAGPGLAAGRLGQARPGADLVLTAASTWAVLGGRSLTAEAGRIQAALTDGDIDRARAGCCRRCAAATPVTWTMPGWPGPSWSRWPRTAATLSSPR